MAGCYHTPRVGRKRIAHSRTPVHNTGMILTQTPLLLICALKEEIRYLWDTPDPPVPIQDVHPTLYSFRPEPDKTAHLLVCGVGGDRAKRALDKVLVHIQPARILIAGWSGALADEMNIFDLVQVDTVHHWESDPGSGIQFDPELGEICTKILRNREGTRCGETTVCSDIVVAKKDLKRQLRDRYSASLVDMESHYLLKIFQKQGIPTAMVRVITDAADESFGFDIENLPVRRAKKLAYLAAHPKQAAAYYRLIKDLKTATTRLADVVPELVKSLV